MLLTHSPLSKAYVVEYLLRVLKYHPENYDRSCGRLIRVMQIAGRTRQDATETVRYACHKLKPLREIRNRVDRAHAA